ncbi:MAG: apolipoprotein N-acyltransferase [Polyangiales bacterium]
MSAENLETKPNDQPLDETEEQIDLAQPARPELEGKAKSLGEPEKKGLWPLPPRIAATLAVLSGVFYWAAFPGVDVWPFAFICWAPLIVALRGQTPKRALGLGLLQGFTCNLLGFYWLLEMLQTFSGFPLALCGFFMVILCGYQGGRMALLGWLHARAERKGWPIGTVFMLAFIGHETLYPLLFPWYTGAQTHKVPVLMQLAELGGPIAIGVALAGSSIAIAEIVFARMENRPVLRRPLAIGFALTAFMIVYGFVRVPMIDKKVAESPKARIGMVQGNMGLGPTEKRDSSRIHRLATDRLEHEGAPMDLVVWSETAVNFVIPQEILGPTLDRVVLRGFGGPAVDTPVLTGAIVRRAVEGQKKGKLFNSAVLVTPDGKVTGVYDKTFLLAFGEYIPFGEAFPKLYEWSPNSGQLTPGTSVDPIPFKDHKITALICYEDILPSFANKAVRHGDPDLLVNVTNDAWFGKSTEPAIHLALAKYRAVEHRRFMVRVTNTGVSAFIDPNGRSFDETPIFQEATRVNEVRWMRMRTPYELWGDIPWWIATAAVIAMSFRKNGAAVRS